MSTAPFCKSDAGRALAARRRTLARKLLRPLANARRYAMGEAKRTTDHRAIKQGAELRQGRPARVAGTGNGGDAGLLRIDFPEADEADEALEEISWDEFFEKFDEKRLAFLYEERTKDGAPSYFNKLVSR
jgi:hypothetical protein